MLGNWGWLNLVERGDAIWGGSRPWLKSTRGHGVTSTEQLPGYNNTMLVSCEPPAFKLCRWFGVYEPSESEANINPTRRVMSATKQFSTPARFVEAECTKMHLIRKLLMSVISLSKYVLCRVPYLIIFWKAIHQKRIRQWRRSSAGAGCEGRRRVGPVRYTQAYKPVSTELTPTIMNELFIRVGCNKIGSKAWAYTTTWGETTCVWA